MSNGAIYTKFWEDSEKNLIALDLNSYELTTSPFLQCLFIIIIIITLDLNPPLGH